LPFSTFLSPLWGEINHPILKKKRIGVKEGGGEYLKLLEGWELNKYIPHSQ
jgi:hypothetical protein